MTRFTTLRRAPGAVRRLTLIVALFAVPSVPAFAEGPPVAPPQALRAEIAGLSARLLGGGREGERTGSLWEAAQERAKRVKTLMRECPSCALEMALPESDRERLPASIRPLVEQTGRGLRGRWLALHGRDTESDEVTSLFALRTEEGGEARYLDVWLNGELLEVPDVDSEVVLSGALVLDDQIALPASLVQVVAGSAPRPSEAVASAESGAGPSPFTAIVSLDDAGAGPTQFLGLSPQEVLAEAAPGAPLATFFGTASFGAYRFQNEVLASVPPSGYYGTYFIQNYYPGTATCAEVTAAHLARLADRALKVIPIKFGKTVPLPYSSYVFLFDNAGCWSFPPPGGIVPRSVLWSFPGLPYSWYMNPNRSQLRGSLAFSASTFFGMNFAGLLNCPPGAVTSTCRPKLDERNGIYDPFDPMGTVHLPSVTTYDFSAYNKTVAGWIPRRKIETFEVPAGSTRYQKTYELYPSEVDPSVPPTVAPQVIKVPNGKGGFYWVEFRAPLGLDENIPAGALNRMLIRLVGPSLEAPSCRPTAIGSSACNYNSTYPYTGLASAHLGSPKEGAGFLPGELFYDAEAKMYVRFRRLLPGRALVDVAFGSSPDADTCEQYPPTVTIERMSAKSQHDPGERVEYRLSVTNEDTNRCTSSSTFAIETALPPGWTQDPPTPFTVTLRPATSVVSRVALTSSLSSSRANYRIRARVFANPARVTEAVFRYPLVEDDDDVCRRHPPTLDVDPARVVGARNLGRFVDVTLHNNMTSACATTVDLILTGHVPAGWNAQIVFGNDIYHDIRPGYRIFVTWPSEATFKVVFTPPLERARVQPGEYKLLLTVAFASQPVSDTKEVVYVVRDPQVGAIVNAANFTSPVVGGSIVSLFGTDLSLCYPTEAQDSRGFPIPTELCGTSIVMRPVEGGGAAVSAPLLFVSPNQINFQMPFPNPEWRVYFFKVQTRLGETEERRENLFPVVPAVFGGVAPGYGRILNVRPDGTYPSNGPGSPAPVGSYVVVYTTGLGDTQPRLAPGQPATGKETLVYFPQVFINGVAAEVPYAGKAGGLVGIEQINVKVPEVAAGKAELTVCAGQCSQPVSIEIAPAPGN